MVDPEGGVYRFAYDALGRRTRTLYPNAMTLETSYDAASRVTAMIYRDGAGAIIESFTYAYDNRGNRTAKIFADGVIEGRTAAMIAGCSGLNVCTSTRPPRSPRPVRPAT